jgi:hypothetical protein
MHRASSQALRVHLTMLEISFSSMLPIATVSPILDLNVGWPSPADIPSPRPPAA